MLIDTYTRTSIIELESWGHRQNKMQSGRTSKTGDSTTIQSGLKLLAVKLLS